MLRPRCRRFLAHSSPGSITMEGKGGIDMNPRPLTCCVIVVLVAALAPSGRAATLVEKGKARAVIIVPEKASPVAENAARVLQAHIKQISGAELPIRKENTISGDAAQDQAWIL